MSAPFIFTENPAFTAEVKVMWPENGSFQERTFTGHFVLSGDVDLSEPVEGDTVAERRDNEIERLAEVFVGWDGIGLPDGSDLAVTEEAITNLLHHVPVRMAVAQAYIAQVFAGGLRLGNFAPSLAGSGGGGKPKKKRRGQR